MLTPGTRRVSMASFLEELDTACRTTDSVHFFHRYLRRGSILPPVVAHMFTAATDCFANLSPKVDGAPMERMGPAHISYVLSAFGPDRGLGGPALDFTRKTHVRHVRFQRVPR
jgi:hypothetical protein